MREPPFSQEKSPLKTFQILKWKVEKSTLRTTSTFHHQVSVWLKIGSIPANIDRFRSHTGNIIIESVTEINLPPPQNNLPLLISRAKMASG